MNENRENRITVERIEISMRLWCYYVRNVSASGKDVCGCSNFETILQGGGLYTSILTY